MNKKQFEIFKRYRKRKYDRDLEGLQSDFAARGLAYSGLREKAQQSLKEDYEDQVAMKQDEAAIGDEESKQRSTNIQTNRILAGIAIFSFGATIFYAERSLNEQYRPYVVFEETDFNYLVDADEKDNVINDNKAIISTTLSNTGLVPAKYKISEKTSGAFESVSWTPKSVEEGIIAPKQEILLSWQVEWDTTSKSFSDWRKQTGQFLPIGNVAIKVNYSRITHGEFEYYTVLGSRTVLDEKRSIDKETEVISGKFDWSIKEMN